jgi:GNAT superfamily N-acetyltransferase
MKLIPAFGNTAIMTLSNPTHDPVTQTVRRSVIGRYIGVADPRYWRIGMIRVRSYSPDDYDFVLGLAPRLAIGMQPWRNLEIWLKTVEEWLTESIRQHHQKTKVLIAEDERGERLGFATVSHDKHFTGQPQAYIGELVTGQTVEGRGVGTALVEACENWAREQGYNLLTVSTGAGNARALRFYKHLDFHDEDVTLTKLL